ncbi:hypothetical protein D3C84_1124050 [compost metagenome]
MRADCGLAAINPLSDFGWRHGLQAVKATALLQHQGLTKLKHPVKHRIACVKRRGTRHAATFIFFIAADSI